MSAKDNAASQLIADDLRDRLEHERRDLVANALFVTLVSFVMVEDTQEEAADLAEAIGESLRQAVIDEWPRVEIHRAGGLQ